MSTVVIKALIRLYQATAPQRLRGACRYEPSCSNYALLAIDKYGAWKGSGMALRRIHRCRVPNGGEDYP
ncbi:MULTISPECIES: membrane protein insertion efficiency factor YidD [Stutzerimonas stutzeri group]|uniref:membrane protein insertion efficiency factor YidD n=1 Tax=Stutzerimonas stutzeri group TaxID=136846 RepID=UPI001F1ACB0B|nr:MULTISPECIES: membrane protein insertion efficiency factor YidD [Stutzerimonas stutzeri group]MBK3759346.1 membrane protein insertion efficiency factor YidD [Stutzerimonas frequens]